ncbi:MAG: hypothetical protein P8Z73_02235 [Desulfobacteraceae bacterium]
MLILNPDGSWTAVSSIFTFKPVAAVDVPDPQMAPIKTTHPTNRHRLIRVMKHLPRDL